jgi:hypothetical protein
MPIISIGQIFRLITPMYLLSTMPLIHQEPSKSFSVMSFRVPSNAVLPTPTDSWSLLTLNIISRSVVGEENTAWQAANSGGSPERKDARRSRENDER